MHDEGIDSSIKIFANIFISFIGAGILGLPYAFKEAGLIEGILIMSLVGAVSVKAMLLLIDCKDRMLQKEVAVPPASPPQSAATYIDYGDVGYAAMGTVGKVLVDLAIIISQVGFCCAYLIFISENLNSIFPGISTLCYLFTLLVPLVFLTNLRHLKSLATFSLVADFANVFAYGIVFYFDLEHRHLIHFHARNFSLEGLPFFLGVSIYCFEGAGLILSLEASVTKDMRSNFRFIFKMAIIATTTLYVLFGVCGYLSFGQETSNIITLNLPPGLFPFIVKGCLCFSLFFTYPIMMFPVAKIIERMTMKNPDQTKYSYITGCAMRTLLVVVTGLTVLIIPNFSTLMALVGSGCCTLLAFILPGIFHWRLFSGELSAGMLALDIFLILLGVVGSGIGIRDALLRLYEGSRITSSLLAVSNSTILKPG